MTIPDDATIRQLDGPALTRLALTLALAPTGFMTCGNDILSQTALPGISRHAWRPHTNVTQARTLFFDRLPSFGFVVTVIGFGRASAQQYLGTHLVEVFWVTSYVGGNKEPSEAMALLRCACLARAAQLREEAVPHG